MSGKYVGCPFWSVEALKTLERVFSENPGRSLRSAATVASKRTQGEHQLQHEHVFPRKAWRELMSPRIGKWQASQADELVELLDRYCVGCIVTMGEHRQLGDEGVLENPWERYQGSSIRLVPSESWKEPHRTWIAEADLIGDARLPRSA